MINGKLMCPICGKEFPSKYAHESGSLAEEYGQCDGKNHFYKYAYQHGNTEESIGSIILHHSLTFDEEQDNLHELQREMVLTLERNHYLRKLVRGDFNA